MARQEFLSGGFIGKLGDVIGSHWWNKRYVKSYVIPSNPRTPLQQAHRNMFTIAVRLAQEAFNINKGDPAWANWPKAEFSYRVGTALRRLERGASEAEALPLYPDGWLPTRTLDYALLLPIDPENSAFYYNGAPLPQNAQLDMSLSYFDWTSGGQEQTVSTATAAGNFPYLICSFPNEKIISNRQIVLAGASTDAGKTVINAELPGLQVLGYPLVPAFLNFAGELQTSPSIDQDGVRWELNDPPDSGGITYRWGIVVLDQNSEVLYAFSYEDQTGDELIFEWADRGLAPPPPFSLYRIWLDRVGRITNTRLWAGHEGML